MKCILYFNWLENSAHFSSFLARKMADGVYKTGKPNGSIPIHLTTAQNVRYIPQILRTTVHATNHAAAAEIHHVPSIILPVVVMLLLHMFPMPLTSVLFIILVLVVVVVVVVVVLVFVFLFVFFFLLSSP